MAWIPEPGSGGVSSIGDLADVDLSTPPDPGDALVWDPDTEAWVPGEVAAGGDGAYAETIGDNSNTSFQVTHNLGTQDLVVQLWDLTGAEPIEATGDASQIEINDDNNITVTFSAAPATDSYRVVILASGGSTGGGGGRLQVEWEDEVETGPAQDTATSGSYNRIEGVLVSLVPLFWIEAVTVYSNAAATYELVIGGKVVWAGALGVTGSGGSLVVLDEPVLLGSFPAPSTPVIWRVATATDVPLYGRDANYADDYFSMQADNRFQTVSGSGNSSATYCPAFKIHGRPGNLDWQSIINPPT